jgi:hypothetical protein
MSVIDEAEPLPEHNRLKQCRICLDNDNTDDIISPCLCSGSSAYVHRTCLNKWRSENANGKAFKICDVCQFEYIIEIIINDSEADRKRLLKYRLLVSRDLSAIILLIQLVIISVASLLKAVDKFGENIKHLFSDSTDGFMVYYLSAVVLLLAIIGLVGLIIVFYVGRNSGGTSTNNRRYSSSNRSTSSTSSGNGLFVIMVVIILVCALIGIVIGIILSVITLRKIMKHHASKLWLRQEAEKYIVKDFQGRRNELERYKERYHMFTEMSTA